MMVGIEISALAAGGGGVVVIIRKDPLSILGIHQKILFRHLRLASHNNLKLDVKVAFLNRLSIW